MLKKYIELKSGSFTFLVFYLYNNNIEFINKYLYEKIKKNPHFFHNAPIVINISGLLNIANWKKIKNVIISHGFFIVGVTGCHNYHFKKIIYDSGLPIISEGGIKNINIYHNKMKIISNPSSTVSISKIEKTHFIDKPIRSGQKIYAKHADLIITNNVSAGAELVADGNIHIYGILRGRVLAGARGDITSKIFCTRLFAELVSISGEYWLSDQIPVQFIGKSAQIFLKNKFLNIHSLG
ncbi:septum site-determining protein MinC [Buchnera aphidicola]|uniref:septum site-determining protein MinC n=1 Tax=Buchnera aphidicola TaxID=9 RepID=UPI003BEF367E